MGASLLFIIVMLFFHSSQSANTVQPLIQGVCELLQVFDGSNNLIGLNRTSKCTCEGIAVPTWIMPKTDKLQILDLRNCKFVGTILNKIDPTNQVLSVVDIEGNFFEEPIPPFIGQLFTLTIFDISHNRFNGAGVSFVNTRSNMRVFDVSYNQLTGNPGLFFLPDYHNPELDFCIAQNNFFMLATDRPQLPSSRPSYIGVLGNLFFRPQISCIIYTRGSNTPSWCNVIGPGGCACEDVCGNDWWERGELCEISGSKDGVCCDGCDKVKSNTTSCPADQPCLIGTCNNDGICHQTLAPSSTVCRPATEPCDVPENCTGLTTTCPADKFAASSKVCRPQDGVCDIADYCTGNNATCPPNSVSNSSLMCRPKDGDCDIAEFCNGVDGACPSDVFHGSDFVCRAANGSCDAIEYCSGDSGGCPTDSVLSNHTLCRPANGTCDVDDYCTGNLTDCPTNFAPSSLSCRPAFGICDSPEFCTGNTSDCPSNLVFGSSHVCRDVSGDCDKAEFCDGLLTTCPPDTVFPSNTTCRIAQSACDITEVCDGNTKTCPPDIFKMDNTIICREVNGSCDLRESCTGLSPVCPTDIFIIGDLCRPAFESCDIAEFCTGTAASCPPDLFYNASFVCREPKSVCDIVERCSGVSPSCPVDKVANSTVVCRPANLSCDVTEKCDGVTPDCPSDGFQPSSLVCRGSNGLCDIAENCTGESPSCPDDSLAGASVVCRNSTAPCDATEYCPGNSPTCPPDTRSSSSHMCRPPQAPCDAPEYCTGDSLNCPPDVIANSSTICRDAADTCDKVEYCNGSSIYCPADTFEHQGLLCRPNGGRCDVDEHCNGTSPFCPPNKFVVSTGPTDTCLPALGQCGPAQYCDGTRPTCPDRIFVECPGGICDNNNGACVCAKNTTVYPACEEFCGDYMCNQKGVENCVNCPSDCKAPCNLCGDGICTTQLAEDCNTCYSDCSRICPLRRCTRNCVNGQCSNGKCLCRGGYFGPTCSEKPLRVEVTPLGGYPAVVAIVTFPSGQRKRFTMGLVEILEETPFGNIERSLGVSNTLFSVNYTFDGTLQMWTFTKSIVGFGQVSVYFSYAPTALKKRAVISQIANTFQMSVSLGSWAFSSASNNLRVITENTIEDLKVDPCNIETSVYGSNMEWFVLHHEEIALYYEMAQIATLDGYPRYVTNAILTGSNTVTFVPFFWSNLSLSTTFGFIPYKNFTGCNAPIRKSNEKKWEPYLAIPAVIIFLIIIFLVIMCILRPTRCFRRRRNVPSFDSKHPMVDPKGSEMVILPPPPPPAAPEPQSPPPPPPPHEPWQDTRHLPVDPRMYAPPSHMSYAPPPSSTSQSDFGRPMHASAPYPQFTQQESHHNLLPPPAPSAPMPSPDGNQNYMPDE